MQKTRKAKPQLEHIDVRDLPVLLRYGIPPAMTVHVNTTYWGAGAATLHTTDGDGRSALGAGRTRHHQNVADSNETEAEEVWKVRGRNWEPNARQAFQQLRGAHTRDTIIPPEPCHQDAPRNINVYTNGSVHNPMCQLYSLSGAGVWWPG